MLCVGYGHNFYVEFEDQFGWVLTTHSIDIGWNICFV